MNSGKPQPDKFLHYTAAIAAACLIAIVYLLSTTIKFYSDHASDIRQIRESTEGIAQWINQHRESEAKYMRQAEAFLRQVERLPK